MLTEILAAEAAYALTIGARVIVQLGVVASAVMNVAIAVVIGILIECVRARSLHLSVGTAWRVVGAALLEGAVAFLLTFLCGNGLIRGMLWTFLAVVFRRSLDALLRHLR